MDFSTSPAVLNTATLLGTTTNNLPQVAATQIPVVSILNIAILSGLCALFLLLTHWAAPRLKTIDSFNSAILNSIAAGLALGYVFLHALPHLVHSLGSLKTIANSHFLGEEKNLLFVIFVVIVSGFCLAYFLEKIATEKTKKGQEPGKFIYGCHIGMLSYINFSVSALMIPLCQSSIYALLLFTVVMSFHFLLEEHSLSHHFPSRFQNQGRYLIMAAVVGGWAFGVYTYRLKSLFPTYMDAFLVGILILATAKTEFSLLKGRSHFPTFIASLVAKTLILFILLLLEDIG